MKTAKKILSLLLCMCMVMTCMGFSNVYAVDEEEPTDPPSDPPHTHSYGDPEWEWADDYSSATAKFVCAEKDDEQTQTDNAPVMSEVKAADCENDQIVSYTAKVVFDGVEYTDTVADVTIVDTATGHSYGEPEWEWADDYSSATAKFVCAENDDEQTQTDNAPVMSEVKAADCENDQIVSYTAKVVFDGVEYTDTVADVTIVDTATGHSYGAPEWEWADDYSSATAKFVCAKNDDEQTQTDNAPVMSEVKAADCENDQIVSYTAKVVFEGVEYTDTVADVTILDTATGHSYDDGTVVPSTCTENGYTVFTCTDCGDVYYRDMKDAQNHAFGDWTVSLEPKCLTEGQEYRKCTRCDATETRILAALGHAYKAETTVATCTKGGFTTYTCERCQDTYTDNNVDALGHSYDAEVKNPTCTERGFTTYTCKHCQDTYEDNYVDALGHSYDAKVKNPTCTEKGFTTYTCKRCQDTYEDNYVNALGHTFDVDFTQKNLTDYHEEGDWFWQDENGLHKYRPATFTTDEAHQFVCKRCKGEDEADLTAKKEFTFSGTGKQSHSFHNDNQENLGLFDIKTGTIIEDIEAMTHSFGKIEPYGYCYNVCQDYNCKCDPQNPDNYHESEALNDTLQGAFTEKCTEANRAYVKITMHIVDAWTFIEGTANCYFNGYEIGTCSMCDTVTYRVRPGNDKMKEIDHTYPRAIGADGCEHAWITVDGDTHMRECSVCKDGGVSVVETQSHTFSEWSYCEDNTFFKNGHDSRICLDCGYIETREADGTSTFKKIVGWILGSSVFGAWIFTGISVWLAKLFGVSDAVTKNPFKDFILR